MSQTKSNTIADLWTTIRRQRKNEFAFTSCSYVTRKVPNDQFAQWIEIHRQQLELINPVLSTSPSCRPLLLDSIDHTEPFITSIINQYLPFLFSSSSQKKKTDWTEYFSSWFPSDWQSLQAANYYYFLASQESPALAISSKYRRPTDRNEDAREILYQESLVY